MPRETALISITRVADLLDRLDPRAGHNCTVPGCVHDVVASARIARGRSRPPQTTAPSGAAAQAA